MFTFTGTIKDAYGLTHTNPVFVVKNFNSQNTRDLSGQYNTQTHEQTENTNEYQYVNYTISYWTNEAAKDEGAEALMFIDSQFNANFNIQPEAPFETAEEVLAAIEAEFKANILPEFVEV